MKIIKTVNHKKKKLKFKKKKIKIKKNVIKNRIRDILSVIIIWYKNKDNKTNNKN